MEGLLFIEHIFCPLSVLKGCDKQTSQTKFTPINTKRKTIERWDQSTKIRGEETSKVSKGMFWLIVCPLWRKDKLKEKVGQYTIDKIQTLYKFPF